jgi:hypothetical protein
MNPFWRQTVSPFALSTEIEQKTSKKDGFLMTQKTLLDQKFDAIGWGLFFVWVGIALLLDVGWGLGLLGIGLITLGVQGARHLYKVRVEGFWVVVGVIFLLGGIMNMAQAEIPLVPILLILAGATLLFSVVRKK